MARSNSKANSSSTTHRSSLQPTQPTTSPPTHSTTPLNTFKMLITKLIIATAAILPVAVADCTYSNRECRWFGSSPGCGSSSSNYGEVDSEGRQYVLSTRDDNIGHICQDNDVERPDDVEYIGASCCDDYGVGCFSGYKRLWCFPAKGNGFPQ